MNKKYHKIIQINMIIISMLTFLGSHLLVALKSYIAEPNFFGDSISINLLIDISLTTGFLFLFIVIIIILIDI